MSDGIAEIDIKIAKLSERISKLSDRRQKIAFKKIRGCKHESVVVSNGETQTYPWRTHVSVTCLNCGIGVYANGCGSYRTNVLNFEHSRLVAPKPGETINRVLTLSHKMMEVIQFPRRFEETYRRKLIALTPWKYDKVMKGDSKRIYCLHTDQFKNEEDWADYVREKED